MSTRKGQETEKNWGIRKGANDKIVKPIDQEALLQKIDAFS
jgi:DNA-binding response OmpR family regulator